MARLFGDWRVWLFAVFAGYMYFVEIAPTWTTFRYKMTVEIQTPEGVKTGSSVVEYVRRPDLNLPGIAMMLVGFSTRQGTLLRAQHWTRGLATIIEIWPAGWVVIPRRPPYGVYKVQPGQLNSSLPRIEVPFQDGFSAYWVPNTGNLEAAHYTTAGEIKKLAEGVKMKTLIIEPTSAPLLTRVSDGDPPWVVKLRSTGTVRISNRGRGRTSLHIRNIESGW